MQGEQGGGEKHINQKLNQHTQNCSHNIAFFGQARMEEKQTEHHSRKKFYESYLGNERTGWCKKTVEQVADGGNKPRKHRAVECPCYENRYEFQRNFYYRSYAEGTEYGEQSGYCNQKAQHTKIFHVQRRKKFFHKKTPFLQVSYKKGRFEHTNFAATECGTNTANPKGIFRRNSNFPSASHLTH